MFAAPSLHMSYCVASGVDRVHNVVLHRSFQILRDPAPVDQHFVVERAATGSDVRIAELDDGLNVGDMLLAASEPCSSLSKHLNSIRVMHVLAIDWGIILLYDLLSLVCKKRMFEKDLLGLLFEAAEVSEEHAGVLPLILLDLKDGLQPLHHGAEAEPLVVIGHRRKLHEMVHERGDELKVLLPQR